MSETARTHRLGLFLKSKDRRLSRNISKKSVITNSKQLTQKKSADSYKDNYGDRNWNFVKLINKVPQKWKNYGNSGVLPSIRSRDENLSWIKTLFWNYQAEYRNCKMKKIVWTILRIFRMLNQFAVEIPTLPVDQCHSHFIRYLEECCDSVSYRRAAEKDRQALGTNMAYRETFLQIHLHLHQLLILKNYINGIRPKSRSIHPQWRKVNGQNKIKIWDANQDRQPKIQSSSVEEIFEKNYGADQQRLQISDLHFDKFPTPATVACWKIRYKTEVCTCSQFPTEAMQWIKEVEMVGSVDDLNHRSVRGIRMPNFEVLDARIASALNNIIHNSHFKRRISLEEQKAQKQDRFLRGRQIVYLIYDFFRVIGVHDPVENYADLFTISLRNDDIQEFVSKWDGILLSMTKIPPDDILEGLYKLRRRGSEKLKTVLELYDLEIHQKKLGPDYHRLKTMVKRSIEQEIRNKNFGSEMEILRRTP